MHIDGNWQIPAPRHHAADSRFPLLTRFAGKLVRDILPAALASAIGGFLFTQYHAGRAVPPPAAEVITPASAEALALVRDEHEAIVGYLKAQLAAEKSRLATQDADTARAVADAKAAQEDEAREKALAEQNAMDSKLAAASPARHVASATPVKVVMPRAKPTAPTEVAQAQAEPKPEQADAAPGDRLARDPDSLLAKTLDLKDHVVAATKQAVAALGDMFASVGERIGGSAPGARPFNSDS
jgi:Tfp pilus assembly protein FimV